MKSDIKWNMLVFEIFSPIIFLFILTGKRKKAKAQVVLREKGTGKWDINGQDITYFPDKLHRYRIK